MSSSETDSQKSTNDTHQVLGLAVGLGVGIPVILVIIVMWFVTVRHRRMARLEDERHKEIDLDAEISAVEEKQRRHRPVPGSATYLAKQHAASQRSLNDRTHNMVAPNLRNEHAVSMVSQGTKREDLVYTPYLHEKAADSIDNLTRDLNNLDAPKYPKMGLRSSSSSGSLMRDEWSYRTSLSDAQSFDSHSLAHSVGGTPQKSAGSSITQDRAAAYGQNQYPSSRFEDKRLPSTLQEEEEHPRRSPFEDEAETFSFEENSIEVPTQHNHSRHDSLSQFGESDGPDGSFEQSPVRPKASSDLTPHLEAPVAHEQFHKALPQEPKPLPAEPKPLPAAPKELPQVPKKLPQVPQVDKYASIQNQPANSEFFSSTHPEDPLVSGSQTSLYVDSMDRDQLTTPIPPQHFEQSHHQPAASEVALEQPNTILTESVGGDSARSESFDNDETIDDSQMHLQQAGNNSHLGVEKIEPRAVSSLYEYPHASNGPQTASAPAPRQTYPRQQSEEWQPVTPQTYNEGFDYHLESSQLSPTSPLHSVPSISGISRISKTGSAPGSRRESMSEYMPDVPHINQPIPGSPGSPKRVKRNTNSPKYGGLPAGSNHIDSSVFMEKQKKFGNNARNQKRLPSASQMTL